MKKNKTNEIQNENIQTENIISDVILMPVVKPINLDALTYLGWFLTDVNNLNNWARQLFATDVDLRNQKNYLIKTAADMAITELEDDIAKLKKFLADYVPPNPINKNQYTQILCNDTLAYWSGEKNISTDERKAMLISDINLIKNLTSSLEQVLSTAHCK